METQTHWKKNFNYNYLGSYSLDPGKEITLQIQKIVKEKVKDTSGKEQDCTVAYFKQSDKPMVLNKTNCKTIAKIYATPYLEDWVGKFITIYSAKVRAFGEETEALRVKDVIPNTSVDNKGALNVLKGCTTLQQLQFEYMNLTSTLKADPEVLKLKDKLKNTLPDENI